MKNRYQRKKNAVRQEAIDWQHSLNEKDLSYGELATDQYKFEKLAKRYGLVREFRENGII